MEWPRLLGTSERAARHFPNLQTQPPVLSAGGPWLQALTQRLIDRSGDVVDFTAHHDAPTRLVVVVDGIDLEDDGATDTPAG